MQSPFILLSAICLGKEIVVLSHYFYYYSEYDVKPAKTHNQPTVLKSTQFPFHISPSQSQFTSIPALKIQYFLSKSLIISNDIRK